MSQREAGQVDLEAWQPRTRVGRLVKEGKIKSIDEIFRRNLPILETEIVDYLLPGLDHEVIDVSIVQKMTDAGRITRFRAVVVVGNKDGYVGLGKGKARQFRFAIEKAIRNAKLNIIPVRRGCGSWECTCGEAHSVPFTVRGKSGSVEVILKPAPKGTGLVAGDVAKVVLRLAGISDVWTFTKGETRTSYNFARATYLALRNTYRFVTPADWAEARLRL
ncbi:30S ribosomal protein S5P [Aeropyrum pernix K1]|uniref:Small ribosomal subunit protein uS5 n=1 Tax=Aeropyrum pernix (strain ATCC 700893 / DSM 11879 / JCM 9820 / NBRC 100138 / K1) TaxID=272557 RepID=RS5_AERPE|nr:30S ribosomal protein S5 [Aeropyrum pernix]Q9YF95.1 RecName: Full=Small ribosomal subunit protein uS5; AltName: Full=30S ribosomal protein S5 [Aeropyrum pernix K1]BAA79301.1 30S ribosomal protein S5P [Aeropyrum pernix K1]